jgi:RHS repeat-associated protein
VYQPFGGAPYAWAYGNGATMVGAVDTDGRLAGLNSLFAKTITYNVDNTIYGINDSVYPDLNEIFSYNAQSRLTGTTRSSDPQSFGVDSDGNRTSTTRAGATTSYPIASNGNKVTSWSYMGGDIYSDGVRTYTRDEFDRLAVVTKAGQTVGQYRYDALDRRVYKSTSQGATYFTYAPSGQLLYEQSAQRTVNYVWLAGRLVGISINHGALQSVHTDWLGRPELVTGTSNPTVAWRASNAVYERKITLDNIGGLNVFFPGQYYDSETDLYYNWHRYYDASVGRYIQSDPIGLAGGINTYAYAGGNPVGAIDPTGLAQCDVDDMVALAQKSNPDVPIAMPSMEPIPIINGRTDAGYVDRWPWSSPVINSNLYGGKLSPSDRVELYDTIVHESWHWSRQSLLDRSLLKPGAMEAEAQREAAKRTALVRDQILNGGAGSCSCKN